MHVYNPTSIRHPIVDQLNGWTTRINMKGKYVYNSWKIAQNGKLRKMHIMQTTTTLLCMSGLCLIWNDCTGQAITFSRFAQFSNYLVFRFAQNGKLRKMENCAKCILCKRQLLFYVCPVPLKAYYKSLSDTFLLCRSTLDWSSARLLQTHVCDGPDYDGTCR